MSSWQRNRSSWAAVGVVLLLAATVLWQMWKAESRRGGRPGRSTASCAGVALTPSSDVQTAINEAPSGTTFCFGPGTYAVSSIAPKAGDVLDGGGQGAVLDGGNVAPFGVYGDSTNPGPPHVTIRGFVIRNYNTPLQRGAIQDYNGAGWIVQDNHITKNRAAGVATGDDAQVLNNLVDHNGQEGFSAHGNGALYQGNEISYNNFDLKVDPSWEAGGGKAWGTQHLTFRFNHVHDNGGNGLWDDTNNIYIIYDGNLVNNNWGAGIYHEIGYDATIVDNTISGNGMPTSPGGGQRLGWAWDAGIQLRLSQSLDAEHPLLISRNTLENNYNSITLIDSPSSGCTNRALDEGAYGFCGVENVLVVNNGITMTQGSVGAFQDGAGDGIFTSQNNHFESNRYCIASEAPPNDGYADGWLGWMGLTPTWAQWQGQGLDIMGTLQIGGTCVPS